MNTATSQFIRLHATDDVRQLALQAARYPDVDMRLALDQIAGRQAARTKLPTWAATDDLLYPPHISMEQCSSEQTARYKARLAERLCPHPTTLVDLTGGFGVDFSFMARPFERCTYVEQQPHLCEIARHNFALLGLAQAQVVCGNGVDYLTSMPAVDIIFIDPARRDAHGAKTIAISDCTPDILEMASQLKPKSLYTIIKLSPMLDWHQAVADMGRQSMPVNEVHIVSVKNECKELLLVTEGEKTTHSPLRIYCVNDDEGFSYDDEAVGNAPQRLLQGDIAPGNYLYEPHAAAMKCGCYGLLTARWDVAAIAPNSHLLVSDHLQTDFPGRRFRISAVTSMNKKSLKTALTGIDQANIATRNFPLSAPELRKRLRLKDGGHHYIFATTDATGNHLILITTPCP
uniref:DNA methyltransferase n=1 Tax=Prevotella sp. GTC17253 TaxID=3236793 RepID=A0AB33IQG3_9BACT